MILLKTITWLLAWLAHIIMTVYVLAAPYACGSKTGNCPRVFGLSVMEILAAIPAAPIFWILDIKGFDFIATGYPYLIVATHSALSLIIIFWSIKGIQVVVRFTHRLWIRNS